MYRGDVSDWTSKMENTSAEIEFIVYVLLSLPLCLARHETVDSFNISGELHSTGVESAAQQAE